MRLVRTNVGIWLLASAALFLASAAGHLVGAAGPRSAMTVVVSGSSTVAPLMADIARRFEAANPGVAIDVQSVGSAAGVSDLRGSRCDVAMISRPVAESERDLFPLSPTGSSSAAAPARYASRGAPKARGYPISCYSN